MNVIDQEVNWYEGWANDPILVITTDQDLSLDDFRFEAIESPYGSTLYFAEHESGEVKFFVHDTSNQHGYAGREFTITMKDGSQRVIKGPWSSRSGVMNEYFPHSVECTIVNKYRNSGHITVKLAKKIIDKIDGAVLVKETKRGEVVYTIREA